MDASRNLSEISDDERNLNATVKGWRKNFFEAAARRTNYEPTIGAGFNNAHCKLSCSVMALKF
jgi:anti-sigma-K factor RskA